MSDQTNFIKKVFNLIKNEFELFKGVSIKLKILDFNDLDKGEGHASLTFKNVDFINLRNIRINIINDFEMLKDEDPEVYNIYVNDVNTFLSSLNIDISEQTLIILSLLHEFGHLYHMLDFMKYSHIRAYMGLVKINEEFTQLAFKIKDKLQDNSLQIHLYNNFTINELYSEMFKFKHFMRIWNKIQLIK